MATPATPAKPAPAKEPNKPQPMHGNGPAKHQPDPNIPRDQDPEEGHAPLPETVDHDAESKRLRDEDRERFERQGDKA
jgi:hypothetical protein